MTGFLRCGHPAHLDIYGHVDQVPEGVIVLEGRSILPEERICRYGRAAGPGQGSLALFANIFRYALLASLFRASAPDLRADNVNIDDR